VLIAWGCFYSASFVNGTDMKIWLRQHSYHGPASNVKATGNYKKNLIRGSDIVTDEYDSIVCPTADEVWKCSSEE